MGLFRFENSSFIVKLVLQSLLVDNVIVGLCGNGREARGGGRESLHENDVLPPNNIAHDFTTTVRTGGR